MVRVLDCCRQISCVTSERQVTIVSLEPGNALALNVGANDAFALDLPPTTCLHHTILSELFKTSTLRCCGTRAKACCQHLTRTIRFTLVVAVSMAWLATILRGQRAPAGKAQVRVVFSP